MNQAAKRILICIMAGLIVLCFAACAEKDSKAPEDEGAQEEIQEEAEEPEEEPEEEPAEEEVPEVNTDNITINTQSSIKIEGPKTIYVDPYKRTKATHDADIILITHAHYDHFDPPSLRNAAKDDTVIVGPQSMTNEIKSLGIGEEEVFLSAGAETELDGGITVKAVPAYNLNKNFHPKNNGWLGYIITMDGVRYYAAGDTDALPDLEDIECDIAFVPVGGTYTMTAKEASVLVNKIAPKIAVPIHYGTIVGRAADAEVFRKGVDPDIEVVTKVEDAK